MKLIIFLLCALFLIGNTKIINFQTEGGIPDDSSLETQWKNGRLMNTTLSSLQPYDTFLVPNKTFHLMGGIKAQDLKSIIIQIDGTLIFSNNIKEWPTDAKKNVLDCLQFDNIENVTFTSSGKGVLDGSGEKWWGAIGYLLYAENRPKILHIKNSRKLLVEHLFFKNSPYWTFWAKDIDGLEVRYSSIDARITKEDKHTIRDLTAFNTDGFDVTGKNVWIHDSTVWNQDDCFCVKDGSENMLFENINASGVGLTIGSISGSTVRNITFRNVYMHHTYKGIYMKFRAGDKPGLIADVLYENIYMEAPDQWPIWIGPAQQSDSVDLCAAHPCSICWPLDPFAKCWLPAAGKYENITLRNITINNPKKVGVIMANQTNPMNNVVFDGVRVTGVDKKKKDIQYFRCESVAGGVALGDTWPVPPCFTDKTNRAEEEGEEENIEMIHY